MAPTQQNVAQLMAARNQQNAAFMRNSFVYPQLALAQNGTTWKDGANPILFNAPVTEGGYAVGLTVRHTIVFNYTPAGTGPTVSMNAGAPWNASNISVLFGNQQITVNGYVAHVLSLLEGFARNSTSAINAGNQNADIEAAIYSVPAIASGSNTWQFDVDVPLTGIHPEVVWGMLPIDGTGTKMQISVQPVAAFTGTDPIQNCINTNGTIAVTSASSSVQVIIWTRDYKSFNNRLAWVPQLGAVNGLPPVPTVQIIKPQGLSPLYSGSLAPVTISNPYEYAKLIALVIDGKSSSTFCSESNLQAFEIDRADNTSSVLRKYDSTNGGMVNYYRQVRKLIGQDLDEGVLFYDGTLENIVDPSLRSGAAYFNTLGENNFGVQPGFPAARVGVQVASVSSAIFTPRLEIYGMIINRDGIKLGS